MTALALIDGLLRILRPALFWAAVVLAVLALLDWLVRTRRIQPFHPVARFVRETVSPRFAPMERHLVRAGGNPQLAPVWGVIAVVVAGIVGLSLLEFVRDQVAMALFASQGGAGSLGRVLLGWTFQVLRLALMVRVVSSWFGLSPYRPWLRWAFALTEPILRPLQRVIPPLGMVDISPLVAWFGLGLLESVLMRLVG